jgi:SAM-dependent methyltransferase
MNHRRLYEYRFRNVDQARREAVWREIAHFLFEKLEHPERVLDPAAGRCEFINAIPARERVAIDLERQARAAEGVQLVVGDVLKQRLPSDHFDAVFVSNFLEHLSSQEEVSAFLDHMHGTLRPGGLLAVIGPNFRYCVREYFDMADHTIALTHRSVEEHLYAAGFQLTSTIARFLPYTFGGRLPTSPFLVRAYLRFPPAWRLLGKQFLVLARRAARH